MNYNITISSSDCICNADCTNVISSDEFNSIKKMIDRITEYYHNVFEVKECADSQMSYDCTIHIDCDKTLDSAKTKHIRSLLSEWQETENKKDESLKARISNEINELRKDDGEDLLGLYKGFNIDIYYSRICEEAKIVSAFESKDCNKYKWGKFEEVLAHELFHFFHDCYFILNETDICDDEDHIAHLVEALAEFFCRRYMVSGYSLADKNVYNSMSEDVRDRNDFVPGNDASDGGYSGTLLIEQLLDAYSKDPDFKYRDFKKYTDIFTDSIYCNTAEDICDTLMALEDPDA